MLFNQFFFFNIIEIDKTYIYTKRKIISKYIINSLGFTLKPQKHCFINSNYYTLLLIMYINYLFETLT